MTEGPLGVIRSGGVKSMGSRLAQVFCGGASMGAGNVLAFFGAQDNSNGGKAVVLNSDNQMAVPDVGNLAFLTWNSVTADVTTQFRIFKNGVAFATVLLTGTSGSIGLVGVIAPGDLIAVQYQLGTAPGRTTVQVYAS